MVKEMLFIEMFRKSISFLFFWSCILVFPYAQPSSTRDRSSITIKGRVLDSDSHQAIEYATVGAYNKATNALLSGISTDSKGNFSIENIPNDQFYLLITFMGYQSQRIDKVPASVEGIINVKVAYLEVANKQLSEVEVVAKSKAVEYQLDKKVIDVASQSTAVSATAIEVLENVPSVKVDMDGTVSLRGSTGFTVLIDGKPTPLESSDALRSLPASSIQKIEIITNPSAKYQPDGTSGIVNVIMKKNRANGTNGIVNLNGGRFGTYGGDFLFNIRKTKVNYNIGADYNNRNSPGTMESERILYGLDTVRTLANGDRKHSHIMMGLKGGIDYDFSAYDALSFGFRIGQRDMNNGGNQLYQQTTFPSLLFDQHYTSTCSKRLGKYGSINSFYLHKFADNSDHTLKFQVDFNQSTSDENSITEQKSDQFILNNGKRNRSEGPRWYFQCSSDYVQPLNNGAKFEAGYMGRWERQSQESWLDTLNLATNVYQGDELFHNNANAKQIIQAVYSIYSGKLAALSYQLGLRGEYTKRVINTSNSVADFKLDQWDYFPTLHFSYKLPDEHELMASYSRRIERSRPWDLDPFITWIDAYNVRQGNPNLKNQYIDAFEVGYMKQFKLFYFSLEGYYRITDNKVERIKSVYSDNVVIQAPNNVGKDFSLGIESSINSKLFKFWEINLSGTTYDYRMSGGFGGQSFDRHSFNWSERLNNTFTITKNQQLQFNGTFNSKTVTMLGRNSAYYVVDAGYRMDFFQKKLSLVAQLRDVFSTGRRESFVDSPTIYAHDLSKNSAPMFSFTATYRINNYKAKRNGYNGQGGDVSEE